MIVKMAIVLIMLLGLIPVKSVQVWVGEKVVNMVGESLDSELLKNEVRMENHEILTGRDTGFIWEKHFAIGNYADVKMLEFELEDGAGVILENVTRTDVYKDKFYVISENGYAIVDRDCNCRAFISSSENDFARGESRSVVYLESYDDFSEEEANHFEKMAKKKPTYE